MTSTLLVPPTAPIPSKYTNQADLSGRPIDWIEEKFQILVAWWREGTMYLSSPTESARHPAYQQVIAMGPAVIPLILRDLRDNGGNWYIALRNLVADPPYITAEAASNTQAVISEWLGWGRRHGYDV
jgi:hypothetical protein